MLKAFFAWWAGQLLELLPATLRPREAGASSALLVSLDEAGAPDDPEIVLTERRGRREEVRLRTPLAGFAQGALAAPLREAVRRRRLLVLRPPAGTLLEREITLPLAAEQDLASVLAYEMDRFTPFVADRVFWSFAVLARERGVLRLRLSIVPKAALSAVLAALERAGAAPALIEAELQGGAVRRIRISRPDTRAARRLRTAMTAGGVLCGLLALAVLVLPFVRQSLALGRTEAAIAALAPEVRAAGALRRRIVEASGGANTLAAEQARVGNALEVLAAVTEVLPDDTYLTRFELQRRALTLEGQSAAAAKLIGLLSADPLIQSPGFSAPVTRDGRGTDLFALKATIAP